MPNRPQLPEEFQTEQANQGGSEVQIDKAQASDIVTLAKWGRGIDAAVVALEAGGGGGGAEDLLDLDFSSGDVVLTTEQFTDNFRFTSDAALAVARTLTAPAQAKHFMVTNPGASGVNTLSIVIGSTTIAVAAGDTREFHADGTANGLVQLTDDDTGAALGDINLFAARNIYEVDALANNWLTVAWSETNGVFASMSSDGTGDRAASSEDGSTFISRTSSADKSWSGVAWDETIGIFAGVALEADNVATSSPDGVTWTGRTHSGTPSMSGIASNGGRFVAVGATGAVETSDNGTSWTARTAASVQAWKAVAYSPALSMWAAVASDGAVGVQIMTSTDNGVTWTSRTSPEANQWSAIAWSPELNLWVAAAKSGTNRIMTSPDGITWTGRTAAFAGFFGAVVWNPAVQRFLAFSVAAVGGISMMHSADGENWQVGTASPQSWSGAAYSPTLKRVSVVSPAKNGYTL